MSERQFPPEFIALLRSVAARRPRIVIDHILEHGQITTEEIRDIYGYGHPPRAIRDVREHGIPVETFRVVGSDGRRIAAYRFGDPSEIGATRRSGRTAFSAAIKRLLVERFGARCNLHMETHPENELQIDHRVPYEIAGDPGPPENPDDYMLLCASANRAKSWSCENCPNWSERQISVCRTCYWAFPEEYSHVATQDIRRLDIAWSADEVGDYENLRDEASKAGQALPIFVKNVLKLHLERIREG